MSFFAAMEPPVLSAFPRFGFRRRVHDLQDSTSDVSRFRVKNMITRVISGDTVFPSLFVVLHLAFWFGLKNRLAVVPN